MVDLKSPQQQISRKEYTAMKKNTVIELSGRETFSDSLTELLRTGARQLIQQAIETELTGSYGIIF